VREMTAMKIGNGNSSLQHNQYCNHNGTVSTLTTKKTKISEGYLVRENVKSLSNFVTKFCDQGICEEFHFFRH